MSEDLENGQYQTRKHFVAHKAHIVYTFTLPGARAGSPNCLLWWRWDEQVHQEDHGPPLPATPQGQATVQPPQRASRPPARALAGPHGVGQRQWVENPLFSPKEWCAYGKVVRTNNDIEGWHHALNRWASRRWNLPLYILCIFPCIVGYFPVSAKHIMDLQASSDWISKNLVRVSFHVILIEDTMWQLNDLCLVQRLFCIPWSGFVGPMKLKSIPTCAMRNINMVKRTKMWHVIQILCLGIARTKRSCPEQTLAQRSWDAWRWRTKSLDTSAKRETMTPV